MTHFVFSVPRSVQPLVNFNSSVDVKSRRSLEPWLQLIVNICKSTFSSLLIALQYLPFALGPIRIKFKFKKCVFKTF